MTVKAAPQRTKMAYERSVGKIRRAHNGAAKYHVGAVNGQLAADGYLIS